MILYLIRHGYSHANEQLLVTGTPDDRLTPLGRMQAAALSAWFRDQAVCPDRFAVSHWCRARETAEICFPDANWAVDTRLGETDAGSVANLPRAIFLKEQSSFYENPANIYPDGESHLNLNTRVLDWLDTQLTQPCNSLAVVAHSGPISCLLQHVLCMDMASFPAFLPMHATVSIVHFSRQAGSWKGQLAGFSLGPAANLARVFHGDH